MQGEVSSHLIQVGSLSNFLQTFHTVTLADEIEKGNLLVKLVGDTKEASSSNASRSLEERAAGKCCHGW